jgi:peroxiredoxin
MTRLWIFAAVALAALMAALHGGASAGGKQKEKDFKFEGKLTKDDPTDKRRGGPCNVHTIAMKAGKTYTIDMVSTEMDSYLFLDDSKDNQLAEDDDSGGNLNAQIVFTCTKDGDYKVVCTVFAAEMAGKYVLTVKSSADTTPLATPHQGLIGKAAPDFKADFAVNSEARKLSDFKGSVVLLSFWEARSLACAATFDRLRDWYKDHKNAGLEIVGVTYYNSEIGKALAFEKETGKVKSAETGDKKSDQGVFKELAAHHKLDYPMLALPKAEALRVFDAYAVNGLPQFVLIDREGVVRTVFVGEKNLSGMEGVMKKALETK